MSASRNLPDTTAHASAMPFAPIDLSASPDLAALRPSRSHELTLDWLAAAQRLGLRVDLDASAHIMGAMLRRRGVPSATNLLCLALLYGPARMPLRLIAERCAELGIAQVSEPALLRRLFNAADWLQHLAETVILDRLDALNLPPGRETQAALAATLSSGSWNLESAHVRRSRQSQAAMQFVFDFVPWPEGLYSDRQIHWLLCLRWMFVTSSIKDGPARDVSGPDVPASALDRTRRMAHLLGALSSSDL